MGYRIITSDTDTDIVLEQTHRDGHRVFSLFESMSRLVDYLVEHDVDVDINQCLTI